MPAYQDYISKSQTTRVVGELAAAKTGADAALFEGRTPVVDPSADGITNVDLGLGAANAPRSNLLKAVASTFTTGKSDGAIQGTIGKNANNDIHDTVIAQERDATGVWTCKVTGAGTGWKDKFIPTGCAK